MYVINIDHHASGKPFGALNWIDRHACSVGELVHRMVSSRGRYCYSGDGDVPVYDAAYGYRRILLWRNSGEYFSTGWAELTEAGADPVSVARDMLYFANPFSKMVLLGRALEHIAPRRCADLAVGYARRYGGDRRVRGRLRGRGELCAFDRRGEGCKVFLRELPEGRIRLSLRSKTGDEGGHINVAAISTSG